MPPEKPEPATLPVPPPIAAALYSMEQAIFSTYASSDKRMHAFGLLLELQEELHEAPTRASIAEAWKKANERPEPE